MTVCILQEQIRKPRITVEQVKYWLCRFRELDPTKEEHRQRRIDSFVNSVYVYDDQLILTYSCKGSQETVSLADIKRSVLEKPGGPTPSEIG